MDELMQNYYAVFFNTEGAIVYTDKGQFNYEPLGLHKEKLTATLAAKAKFPANHLRDGVCILKAEGKGLGGFMVVTYIELHDLWMQIEGDAA